ncbi:MAG: hypothetical protein CL768_05890 [Chloroflexi bacterium]|nr:hypothetical protein [Chloroflexota bacterium]
MRAIGYFKAKSADDVSINEIKSIFHNYCELNLHVPVKLFISNNNSSLNKDPEYLNLLEFIRNEKSEYLVVINDVRDLGSDIEDVARAIAVFHQLNSLVKCASEDYPDPIQNAFRVLRPKGVSLTRSASIKNIMQVKAMEGKVLGRPPYGYEINGDGFLEPVKNEASVVELIFKLYTKDQIGLRLIAQHLNDRQLTTRKGSRWSNVGIRDVLKNPVYLGTYTRYGVQRPNSHEPIISAEVFRMAKEQTAQRKPTGRVVNTEPFMLSGILYCSGCDNKMMGVTRRQTWKTKDGKRQSAVYKYYQCQSKNNLSVCDYHTWKSSMLEENVVMQLKYKFDSINNTEDRLEELQIINKTLVKNAERRLFKDLKLYSDGKKEFGHIIRRLADLDNQRSNLKSKDKLKDFKEIITNWDDLDEQMKREFISVWNIKVFVSKETAEVKFWGD